MIARAQDLHRDLVGYLARTRYPAAESAARAKAAGTVSRGRAAGAVSRSYGEIVRGCDTGFVVR